MTENVLQLCKFSIVGCINTFIDWAVYFVILRLFPGESILLLGCQRLQLPLRSCKQLFIEPVLDLKTPSGKEGRRFLKFTLVNTLGLGINSASIYVLLNLNLPHLAALFLATSITFAFNFTLSKLWVFRKGKVVAKTTGG